MTSYRAPKCPLCRWHLSFAAEDRSWIARCWNPNCSVDLVPPTVNESLLALVKARGEVLVTEVAEHFGWKLPNANGQLQSLLRLGMVTRRSTDAARGRRYIWRASNA